MPAQCSPEQLHVAPVEARAVVAAFEGGAITSDAGALLLGATDRAIDLVKRFSACFFAQASCGTIRLKLLKIGAQVRISVRRMRVAMASAFPARVQPRTRASEQRCLSPA